MNWYCQPLQKQEARAIAAHPQLRQRVLRSLELMLDFYGFCLDGKGLEVARAANHVDRFRNLIRHPHNNLRITRILKCLGEVGLEAYQLAFLHALIVECLWTLELEKLTDSLGSYWIHVVKNDEVREQVKVYCRDLAASKKERRRGDAAVSQPPPRPPYEGAFRPTVLPQGKPQQQDAARPPRASDRAEEPPSCATATPHTEEQLGGVMLPKSFLGDYNIYVMDRTFTTADGKAMKRAVAVCGANLLQSSEDALAALRERDRMLRHKVATCDDGMQDAPTPPIIILVGEGAQNPEMTKRVLSSEVRYFSMNLHYGGTAERVPERRESGGKRERKRRDAEGEEQQEDDPVERSESSGDCALQHILIVRKVWLEECLKRHCYVEPRSFAIFL